MIYPAAYRIFFGSMWQENKNDAVFEAPSHTRNVLQII